MIDWSRVAELRDEVGAEDFDEVVELFLEEVDEVVDQLRGGVEDASLEPQLHFLKGSALNLGFHDFSDVCATGETLASKGQGDEVNLSKVTDIYDASRKVFLAELQSRLSA